MPAKKELIDLIEFHNQYDISVPFNMTLVRSLIFQIEREAVEDEINDLVGAEKHLRAELDKIEKGHLYIVSTDSIRAILDIYHDERTLEEPKELNWINYLGKMVTDPEGDEGCLTGYSYEGHVNLCVNGIWWGERSLECNPVISSDPDQIKMF